MVENGIDYDKVVADLEAKRAAFNTAVDGAIQNIRMVLTAMGALPGASVNAQAVSGHGGGGGAPVTVSSESITPATFFGLGIAEAAIKFLGIVKSQKTSREITDVLEAAGYHHTSQNFINTVNTALYRREKEEGDVIKIGRNWALAEWYPGRRRKGREPEHQSAEIEVAPE